MGDDFLAEIKGSSGTFVIHSNTNPHAAAAAMGMMAARSQKAGPYFRVSDHFVPNLDGLPVVEKNNHSTPGQINMNFKNDWVAYLRNTGLPACELGYNDQISHEKNTMRFLNARRRRILDGNHRTVHESRELSIPDDHLHDYKTLISLFRSGGDLNPYLSRHIAIDKRADKNDKLLNSWGINHLHFLKNGTEKILFCIVEEFDVYIIQALQHGRRTRDPWVDICLIQILHDNWPSLISHGKNGGLLPENFTPERLSFLRRCNANFQITVRDGTVYLPPSGGIFASGESQEDRDNCRKIFSELDHWQRIITRCSLDIRSALSMPTNERLVVRMAFNGRDCCFYEPTRAIRLAGFAT